MHSTIKDSAQSITCNPIKPKSIIHMECGLGFFDECTMYTIPDKYLDYGKNAPLIHLSVYTYQWICAKHGIIPNGPYLWKIFEEYDDMKNGIIKGTTYIKKKHLYKNIMLYWWILYGTLSDMVEEVCIS